MAEPDEAGADERGEASIGYAVPYRNPWRVQVVVFAGVVLGVTGLLLVLLLFGQQPLGLRKYTVTPGLVAIVGFVLGFFNAAVLLAASRHRPLLSSAIMCCGCGVVGLVIGSLSTLSDLGLSVVSGELGWMVGCCAISLFRGRPSWSSVCKECGYDAVGLARCPECGWKPVRRPRPALTRAQWWRRVVLGWVVPSVLLLVFSALLLWG